MSFVNAHFVTYVREDLDYPAMVAAGAFSLIGAAAIIGALYLGHLSDSQGRRRWLTFSYQLRTVGFIVVLLSMGSLKIPALGLPALLVGITLVGFSWTSVVSITGAYASDRFGVTNLGTIYGTMFAVMPIGSGFGAYLGGVLYDAQGSYEIAIWSNIVLLIVASVLVASIGERKVPRSEIAAAD